MSKFKMDLSQFKKVSEDGQTATLKHAKGHEIKISKKGLSPDLRKQLEALPLCKADGGYVNSSNQSGALKEQYGKTKVHRFAEGGGAEEAAPTEAEAAGEVERQPAAEPTPAEVPASASQPAPAAPQVEPKAAPAVVAATQATAPVPPPVNLAADLKTQDTAWANDLANGHIKPETYHSLFAKKDTLGKIGTIFGMMLSGAGSGLAHQPNTLLTLMNQEINNDLEAQKNSKVNAQNFIKLNLQHQLQEAQIKKMGFENELTKAQTGRVGVENKLTEALTTRVPHENAMNDAQTKVLAVDEQTKAYALAKMQANRAALHALTLMLQDMALPPEARAQAEQQLAIISQSVQNENYDIADRAAAASALGASIFGGAPGQGGQNVDPEAKFKQDQTMLRVSGHKDLADDRETKHFPGVAGQSSVPLSAADRDLINSGITFQSQLQRFQDWTKLHSGDLNPADIKEGEALAAGLQGAYRQATNGGVYKAGEQDFISSIIDSNPTKFFNKIRVLPQLGAIQKDSQAQLDQLLKSKGFQSQTQPPKKEAPATKEAPKAPAGQPKEGSTGKDKSGQPVVFRGGAWRRQ